MALAKFVLNDLARYHNSKVSLTVFLSLGNFDNVLIIISFEFLDMWNSQSLRPMHGKSCRRNTKYVGYCMLGFQAAASACTIRPACAKIPLLAGLKTS